ncbi:MAG: hypothetical protein ACREJ5_03275 [Geminicoccaceae bacterium]
MRPGFWIRSIAWLAGVAMLAPRLGLALALGACAVETGHRPADAELLSQVKRYYHEFAAEQGGACRLPSMDQVLDSRIEARSEQRIILRVRYSYRQLAGSANAAGCRGTGERVFRIERHGAGWQVVQMSGPGRLSPGGLFRFPFG